MGIDSLFSLQLLRKVVYLQWRASPFTTFLSSYEIFYCRSCVQSAG